MAEITAAAVKALRAKTDLPMMMCKQALVEADGDESQAIEILQEKAQAKLSKRTENPTEEGRVFVKVSDDGSQVAMVELQCESAPVAGSEGLAAVGEALTTQLLTGPGASTPEELLAQPVPGGEGTLNEFFEQTKQKIQENIRLVRIAREDAPFGVYVHHDGKTAVLFLAEGEAQDAPILRDVAMHIAALKPSVALIEQVDPAAVAAERERLTAEAKATGKPDNIVEKIVEGRMKVFYKDDAGVLTEQAFAKDDSKSVSQVLAESGYKAKTFHLWVVGS